MGRNFYIFTFSEVNLLSDYKRLMYTSSLSFSYLGVIKRQAANRIESLLNGKFGRFFAIKQAIIMVINSYFYLKSQNLKVIKEISYIGNNRYIADIMMLCSINIKIK